MAKKRNVVRIISESTARALMKDLKTMSLEEAGRRHGIRNVETIPRLIERAYVRAGRKVPKSVTRLGGESGGESVVKVGGKGTIIIPKKAVIDSFGFQKGSRFTVHQRGKKIYLTAAGPGQRRKASRR